ncbi:MAG: 2Fe-2S iron-sulfur cluster-binding protein, partial [bacterium]
MTEQVIQITVNGHQFTVEERHHDWSLLRYLREVLGLTGTKQGCDNEGTCGLCKVIINGMARNSCSAKLARLNGAVIET